jgi:hypothetical protein
VASSPCVQVESAALLLVGSVHIFSPMSLGNKMGSQQMHIHCTSDCLRRVGWMLPI